jgi:hypothetical protein
MAVTKKAKTAKKTATKKPARGAKVSTSSKRAAGRASAKKTTTAKKTSASRSATPKRSTTVKINDRQRQYLKRIKDAGLTGYEAGASSEHRTIEALVERKLVKRGPEAATHRPRTPRFGLRPSGAGFFVRQRLTRPGRRPTMAETALQTSCLWTAGYGAWPVAIRAERLVTALAERAVTRLVDIRLSPSAADMRPGRYGPKPWTLQTGRSGIGGLMATAGIAYEWLVELGNPQRHDPAMTLLRTHLADPEGGWPVHRGLERLAARVEDRTEVVAILCACPDHRKCHRSLIARALSARHFGGGLIIRDVRSDAVIES